MMAALSQWAHKQWQKRGLVAYLLFPLSLFTALIVKRRQRRPVPPLKDNYPPIIVVGNLLVGGTGKTPVVIHLCHQLKALGWQPGVISRGYGGRKQSEALGGLAPLDPAMVGDEPSLIAAQTGVAVAVHRQRRLAIKKLLTIDPHCDVIIADDGLQHYQLPRAIEIVIQDHRGVGNGWLLPAGPLREPIKRLTTVDWVIQHRLPAFRVEESTTLAKEQRHSPKYINMWLTPTVFEQLSTGEKITPQEWLQRYGKNKAQAMAGIGQPQRFFQMLKDLGVPLGHCLALADHQAIQPSDLQQFSAQPIIITAKDAIKLQQTSINQDPRLWVVHVHARFQPNAWVIQLTQQLRENAHSPNTFPYTKQQ